MTHKPDTVQAARQRFTGGALCLLLFLWAWPAQAQEEQALLRDAERITERVGQIRGLPALGPIKKGVKDRDALRAVIEEKLGEQANAQELARDGRVLLRLGLLDPEVDYRALIVNLLTEQIAGFYDHETKELNLIQGTAAQEQQMIMAHELFHAIQDQHFQLKDVQPPEDGWLGSRHNEDRALARAALIEGDATALMMDFIYYESGVAPYGSGVSLLDQPAVVAQVSGMLQQMGPSALGQSQALEQAPAWMQQSLLFPYLGGLGFIAAMRHQGAWDRLNQVYALPPESTEQILHPERYLEGDAPTLVTLDADAVAAALDDGGAPWEPSYDNVLGEFQLGLWLKHHLGDAGAVGKRAEAAAAGWDGDRLYAFERDGQVAVVLLSVWDSPEEAREFGDALGALVRKRGGQQGATRSGEHGGAACFQSEQGRSLVEIWGSWVIYIDGVPSTGEGEKVKPALGPLRQAIWQTRAAGSYQ